MKKASELHISPHLDEPIQKILELPKRHNHQDINLRKGTPAKSRIHGGNVPIRNSGKVHTLKSEINNKVMSFDDKDESNCDDPHGKKPVLQC